MTAVLTRIPTGTTTPETSRLRAVGLVLTGMLSVQFGGAIAALVFPRAGVTGTVTVRLVIAAAVMLAVCRPRLRGYRRVDWALIVAFGFALAGMNLVFYQAIHRIPLGLAVTIEVLGPLTLSVVTARRATGFLWAGLALAGVGLLGNGGFARLDPVGIAFAVAAGTLWASYIVLTGRAGRRFPKADGLALAMAVAALVSLPPGIVNSGTAMLDPTVLALGAAVALLASIVPYTLELRALRTLPTTTFSLLMSLQPAVAALAGFVVLHQRLTVPDLAAVALVVAASVGAVRSKR